MNNVFALLIKYKLNNYLKYVLQGKWLENPYHNFYHTCCVVFWCNEYAIAENLSEEEIRILLLSALFHDVGHSGGNFVNDSSNIIFAKTHCLNALTFEKEIDLYDKIKWIIDATEFPYIIEDEYLTISQKIIRDADLSQAFMNNTFVQHNIIGLGKEMNLSLGDSVVETRKFLNQVKMYTKLAQKLLKEELKRINLSLDMLEESL